MKSNIFTYILPYVKLAVLVYILYLLTGCATTFHDRMRYKIKSCTDSYADKGYDLRTAYTVCKDLYSAKTLKLKKHKIRRFKLKPVN